MGLDMSRMLETERSSDEALRQPTFVRLFRGAFEIEDSERSLKAAYIILLAGRLGLRTGEIQHVREAWIDWRRGEIAIPRHDPCGCKNCWMAAKQKAAADDERIRDDIAELIDKHEDIGSDEKVEEQINVILEDLTADEDEPEKDQEEDENRTPREILYEERWKPKYERSSRRVPFGYSHRLTAVIMLFFKNHDCLEITQVTMNNLVTDAAENAEGVDSEGITLRGLRATAATHYTTIVRNPKAIQDVMGWTRIETAVRYVRRAGGFTTDVIYGAFSSSELAPDIYPEEPESRYPLIGNPLQYENEPWDPVLYSKDARIDRAEEIAKTGQQLIHPRSNNAPENISYDPTDHEIRNHVDYSSDINERTDGKLRLERPTLAEFFEEHERYPSDEIDTDDDLRKYASIEGWKADSSVTEKEQAQLDDTEYLFSPDVDPKTFDPGPPLSERLKSSSHPVVRSAANTIGPDRLSTAIKSGKRNVQFLPILYVITVPVSIYLLSDSLFLIFLSAALIIFSIIGVFFLPILYQLWPDIKRMYRRV